MIVKVDIQEQALTVEAILVVDLIPIHIHTINLHLDPLMYMLHLQYMWLLLTTIMVIIIVIHNLDQSQLGESFSLFAFLLF